MAHKVELGDEVKDTVTGFKGIASGRSEFLQGCARILIQPPVDGQGKMRESHWVDEPQIVVLKKAKVKRGPTNTGGPMPSHPTRHQAEIR